MSPIVLELPALCTHNSPLSSLSRMQQFNPTSDHITHDQSPPSSSIAHPDGVQILHNEFTTYGSLPSPKDRLSAHEFNSSQNTAPLPRSPCANCGTADTTFCRKDADGNSICSACGEFIYYYFTTQIVSSLHVLVLYVVRSRSKVGRSHHITSCPTRVTLFVHDLVAAQAWPVF
jgi:hypothetical protein